MQIGKWHICIEILYYDSMNAYNGRSYEEKHRASGKACLALHDARFFLQGSFVRKVRVDCTGNHEVLMQVFGDLW